MEIFTYSKRESLENILKEARLELFETLTPINGWMPESGNKAIKQIQAYFEVIKTYITAALALPITGKRHISFGYISRSLKSNPRVEWGISLLVNDDVVMQSTFSLTTIENPIDITTYVASMTSKLQKQTA